MNEMLRNRVSEFLKCSGMTKSQFAKKIDLCSTTICEWLNNNRNISIKAENRIIDFMSEYAERITNVVNN